MVDIERPVYKAMARLPKNVQQRLTQAMLRLGEDPRPPGCIQLKGQEGNYYRIRVGDWRIIYTIYDNKLLIVVVQVGSRGSIYENY